MRFGDGLRAEHLIFVAPEWYPGAGSKFNAKEYVKSLADSSANCVEFYVKDHHGISYYDTEVGVKSSYMEGDYLAELCNEASERGIDVIAYFSVCWDNYMAEKNPSWLMRTPEGNPILARYWPYLCFNTPYKDYMLQQLEEISKYDVKGFWLDILRFPELFRRGCFCDFCRRKFKAITHYDSPGSLDPGNPAFRAYLKFQENSVASFLRDVKMVAGDKEITFNGVGFLTPKAWNDLCGWHNVESHAPEYPDQSFKSRYLSGLRKPWEILTPGTNSGWTSWSAKPADAMKLELAITSSNGGTVTFGTNPSIEGATEFQKTTIASQRKAIGEVYSWIKGMEQWIKGGEKIANIALFYALSTYEAMFGGHPNPGLDQDIFRARNAGQPVDALPREVVLEATGFHKALYDRGFQYEILNEYSIDRIGEFEMLILPDQRYLPDEVVEAIRDFVKNGGKAIATYKTSLFGRDGKAMGNFAIGDLLGVDFLDVSEYTANYVEPLEGVLETGLSDHIIPILQSSAVVRAKEDTKILANLRFPDAERSQTRFFFHEHSGPDPRGVRVSPMVTWNRVGKGEVFYVSAPLGKDFYLREDPSVGEIIRNLVRAASKSIVESTSGVGLEINLTRHQPGSRVVLHLVNHYTSRVEPFVSCRRVGGVEVGVDESFLRKHLGKDVSRVYSVPGKEERKFDKRGGKIRFTVDEVEIYKVIVFE
jgi:hypothetical protein